jgi:hypothetical protein
MPRNATQRVRFAARVLSHQPVFIMKKSSSPGTKTSPVRKSAVAHSTRPRHASFSTAADPESCTRRGLASSSALAVLEPPAPLLAGELRRVRFGYFKPEAREVHVVGSFNGWNPRATPMNRDALGDWSAEVELPTGEHRYRFYVDGEWRDDPSAQQTALNPFGGFDAIMVVV